MIARTLLTTENVGRGVLVWLPQHLESTRCLQGIIRAWSTDKEKIFVLLDKDYGKGKRKGDLIQVDRDICSFRHSEKGD